jgi:hypothetical protein
MCTDYPTCAGDTIPVSNQRYATAASTAFSSATVLTTSPTISILNIAKPTNASPTTKLMYWGIYVPVDTGPGTYYGNITVTGVKSHPTYW